MNILYSGILEQAIRCRKSHIVHYVNKFFHAGYAHMNIETYVEQAYKGILKLPRREYGQSFCARRSQFFVNDSDGQIAFET